MSEVLNVKAGPVFSGDQNFSGNQAGNIVVNGNLTIVGNTVVDGNLTVTGNLINTGGYSLSIIGDLVLNGMFNFTPTSPTATQGNIEVSGDFLLAFAAGVAETPTTSTFNVNAGQSPTLFIGGDLIALTNGGPFHTIDGSGTAGANGLTVEIGGDVKGIILSLPGGVDSASTSSAGNGGTLTVSGDLVNCSVVTDGGASSNNGSSSTPGNRAGNGGTINLSSNALYFSLSSQGGSSSAAGGDAGNGGLIIINGNAECASNLGINVSGGTCGSNFPSPTSGQNGGNGGTININGGYPGYAWSIGGDVTGSLDATLLGGMTVVAGNGGNINSTGIVAVFGSSTGGFVTSGGNSNLPNGVSASITLNGGTGGTINTAFYEGTGDFQAGQDTSIYSNGGNAAKIPGNGGNGGRLQIQNGSLLNISFNGGNGHGGGSNAGSAGNFVGIYEGVNVIGTLSLLDGTVGTAPSAFTPLVYVGGSCIINTLSVTTRGQIVPVGDEVNGNSAVLKISSMPNLSVLHNTGGTPTPSIAPYLSSSIFVYDVNADTWYQNVGQPAGVAGYVLAGPVNISVLENAAAQTTLTGSAGTAVCSQPEQGSSYKKVVVYLNGYTDTGTQTFTFPTPFVNTPFVYGVSAGVSGASASTTSVTFTTTLVTGFVFIEGY